MTDYAERFGANAKQAEYWNTEPGQKWVQRDAELDQRLEPLTMELLRRAEIAVGHRVLDIGCGSGTTTEKIARAVGDDGQVVGVDISEPLLVLARARCAPFRQVRLENADAQVHPFEEFAYDRLVSRLGVMFFSDPVVAFANLRKALKPGGQLHFVCWAGIDDSPWFSVPLEIAKRYLGEPEPMPPRTPGPLAFGEPDYVVDVVTSSGFEGVQIVTKATPIVSADPLEKQAELLLTGGPAARLVAARATDAGVVAQIAASLADELKKHQTEDGVVLGATVHHISARS